jgi:asparagine synthase (glutamine-hydrolysing)
MCGIAGIFSPAAEPPSRALLQAMAATLSHRGPDGFGVHVDGEIGLAHARLAVIDVLGGAQPMSNEDGSIWVVANGEVFNYIELRKELQNAGHVFRTQSDTEVIVHAYEQYGDGFLKFINGQFALALWDASRRRVLLARDRVGIRPLYYTLSRGRLLFASEAKALFAEGSLSPALDVESLAHIFSFWAPLEDRSAFVNVGSVPPGCMLTFEGGTPRLTRYWDWDFNPGPGDACDIDRYAQELRALLEDAVRLQLRSDVPVAAYLSGGLDSTAITSIATRISGLPIPTFSLRFADSDYDEGVHQADAVRALAVPNTPYRCGAAEIVSAFTSAVWHAETPMVRAAPVPLMLLAKRVREAGIKVVLTGEGADEVFAGYDIFREAQVRRFAARQPNSRWRASLLKRLYPYAAYSPVRSTSFARAFFLDQPGGLDARIFSHHPRLAVTRRAWRFFSPALRETLGRYDPLAALDAKLPRGLQAWPALGRDQYVEAHTLTSGYVLSTQGDRMAMAHGVETRLPYFDHRIVEFAGRLPPGLKLQGLREKLVLKRAVASDVPSSIRARSKQPYRAPDSASFFANGLMAPVVAELLAPARVRHAGYFDEKLVEQLLGKCLRGRAFGVADNIAFVGILSTMALHDAFVARRVQRTAA